MTLVENTAPKAKIKVEVPWQEEVFSGFWEGFLWFSLYVCTENCPRSIHEPVFTYLLEEQGVGFVFLTLGISICINTNMRSAAAWRWK